MGMPSYEADIQERALDNRISFAAFTNGSAGAAGIGRPLHPKEKKTFKSVKANQDEVRVHAVVERTKRLVENQLACSSAPEKLAGLVAIHCTRAVG
jgi:hypothetical protein